MFSRIPYRAEIFALFIMASAACVLDGRPPSTTGRVYTRAEMEALTGDAQVQAQCLFSNGYAEVNSAWLRGFEERFRSDLFRKGLDVCIPIGKTGWSEQFNCRFITDLFLADAAAEFCRDMRRTFTSATELAIVKVAYIPAGSTDGHMIVVCFTEHGPVFWDPQVGQVRLSKLELRTVYLSRAD